MRLWLTRRHWNLFARTDPYWAVLTEPNTDRNRWKIDEFFARGRADVEAALQRLREILPDWRAQGHALDFGCGVGRLTQALAARFDQVTGLDIAAEMLALARRHNSRGDRVAFIENRAPDLRQFADGSFTFVLSLITLQHVEPVYSRRYLQEFVRVCAPGGCIIVQIPAGWSDGPPRRRFSLWPATLWKRGRRALRRWLVLEPTMEMHYLPRVEVERLFAEAGADLLAVDSLPAAGPEFISYRYIARRRGASS